jgi:citrate/tricarballylate utilization protein
MQQLEALTRDAIALAANVPIEAEAARQMEICNACRYCEGFCAVFPAMTRRLSFDKVDIHYLANLCHNCGACLHACQYAPPHEFAVNIPRTMAQVRKTTYEEFAWPASFAGAYRRNGLAISLAVAAGIALFLVMVVAMRGSMSGVGLAGNFYAIFPHNLMASMFGAVFTFALIALGVGASRFWTRQSQPYDSRLAKGSTAEAVHDALTLKYLDGGHGSGCNNADDSFTLWRRRFHHFTFYGFMLCFAATSVATLYHYFLDLHAPYAFASLPVLLGTAGGIGLLVGPFGLFVLNLRRHRMQMDTTQRPMDLGFIALLFFTSLTGLLLLALRGTSAMPGLLAVHLGVVLALFSLLPYGKFAHAVYRVAALLKFAIEKRQPSRLQLGSD